MTPRQVDELMAAIEKVDVFAMEDSYYFGGTDHPMIVLSITLNGRTKTITHYPALHCDEPIDLTPPQGLCDLERSIQAAAGLTNP